MKKVVFIIVLILLVVGAGYYAWSKGVFGGAKVGSGGIFKNDTMVKVTDPAKIQEAEADLTSCLQASADDKQTSFCYVMASAALGDMSICDRDGNTDKAGCKVEVQKLWEATKEMRENPEQYNQDASDNSGYVEDAGQSTPPPDASE